MKRVVSRIKSVLIVLCITLILLNFLGFVTSGTNLLSDSDKDVIMTVRILDFESPARLGDFLKFTYYLRDISGIGDTLNINFQIEKDGEAISSGSDTVYVGYASNRTIATKIFLPSSVESGIYRLKVRANYENNTVESYRTIEIIVKNGIAIINSQGGLGLNVYVILSLILLAFSNILIIYFVERKRGEQFTQRSKLPILTISSFLILGGLIYYLNSIGFLPQIVIYFYFILLGILLLLILTRITQKNINFKGFAQPKNKDKYKVLRYK